MAPLIAALIPMLSACHHDMYEEPKFLPDQEGYYFPGTSADRHPVAQTVPRGPVADDSPFYTGEEGSVLSEVIPIAVTTQTVAKGREEFEINCSACHGRDGYGQGMVVQRGFPAPPSFHTERLRAASAGHFFQVITHGYGVMYPFGSRIGPADRWAIISYIRALQFSQNAPVDALSPQDRVQLEGLK